MDHPYANAASTCGKPSEKSTKGSQCFAINCYQYQNEVSKRAGISFHKFPHKDTDAERHELWSKNCRRERKPSAYSVLCSRHFPEDSLDRTGQIVRLRPGATPTIFELPQHLQPQITRPRPTKVAKRALEELNVCDVDVRDDHQCNLVDNSCNDHSYAFGDNDAMRKKIKLLESRVDDLSRKVRRTTAREQRSKRQCRDLIATIKEKNLITEELEQKLEAYKDIPEELFNKPSNSYTEEQKKFALTLHLYSPKGYEYLRKTLPLPSPRSLRRWMEKVDAEPGLNLSMLNTLEKNMAGSPDDYTHCCLMIDAMHIRKQLIYEAHTKQTVGFVDLGAGPEDDSQEASEALVFMLVGLKSRWKCPIAYYLTRSLGSIAQRELLEHCLEKVAEIGMKVHCITMDGHASNLGMCSGLGASYDVNGDLRPFFVLPGSDVKTYILLDPCHMLKLVRNMLESYGVIQSPQGSIMWNYIKDLHNQQEDLGLRLANKLTSRHIAFHQQKMKVSVAAQTLSNSVAVAMLSLKEIGVGSFQDCGPTAEFIQAHLYYGIGCRSGRVVRVSAAAAG